MFPYWETDSFKELKKEYDKGHNSQSHVSKSRTENHSKPLPDDIGFVGDLFNILSPLTKMSDCCGYSTKHPEDNYNVVEITDDTGNVVANRIDVVVAPFRKEDISISVNTENRRLVVSCDRTENEPESNERCVINGISHKSRSWSWDVPKNAVVSSISSKMDNGMLKITIPLSTPCEKKKSVFSVNID